MRTLIEKEWSCRGPGYEETLAGVRWIDIETRKVEAPESWPYRTRWQTFMVGVSGWIDPGVLFLDVVEGTEAELMLWLVDNFEGHEMRYDATRDFDQMVLRGRFTNARRAHNPEPGPWPNLDAIEFEWVNRKKALLPPVLERAYDLPSKDVPRSWSRAEENLVATHCGRDVIATMTSDPDFSATAGAWLKMKDFLRGE